MFCKKWRILLVNGVKLHLDLLIIDNENSVKDINTLIKVENGEYKIRDYKSNILDIEIKCNTKELESKQFDFFILRDISERKQLKKELKESKEMYEKLIDILPEGICVHDGNTYSFVSKPFAKILGYDNPHDIIGTPLNILLSSLQLIKVYIKDESNVSFKQVKKYTNIMKQNSYRLLRLINNLLDVTKMDSGFYKLNLHNCNLVNVVEDIT